jgi:hypothetical protein
MPDRDPSTPSPAQAFRLDRSAFSVGSLAEDDDGEYWQAKTPHERMTALEYLRRMAYGPAATARIQMVLEVGLLGED